MCQRCHVAKDEVWAEVRDLTEFQDGPLSVALREKVDKGFEMLSPLAEMLDVETDYSAVVEFLRCQMISQRLAFIASYGDSHMHGEAPSIILGTWGGDLVQRELHAIVKARSEGKTLDEDSTPLDVYRLVMGNLIAGEQGV